MSRYVVERDTPILNRYRASTALIPNRYGVNVVSDTAAKVSAAEQNPAGQKLTDIIAGSLAGKNSIFDIFTKAKQNAQPVIGNSPLQINSLTDVLFNDAALKAAYGKSDLGTRIRALVDMQYAQRTAPLLAGKVWEPILNTVQSLGEDLNIAANPVKSLFATPDNPFFSGNNNAFFTDYDTAKDLYTKYANDEYLAETDNNGKVINYRIKDSNGNYRAYNKKGLDIIKTIAIAGPSANIKDMSTFDRFKSAIGIGDNGHINYDITTNSIITDILGELVLDPFTLVDGVADLAKTASKSTVKDAVKAMAKDLPDELTETLVKVGQEKVTADVMKILDTGKVTVASNNKFTQRILNGFLKEAASDSFSKTYTVKNLKDALNAFLITDSQFKITARDASKLAERAAAASTNRMTTVILGTVGHDIAAVKKGSDKIQSTLLKLAIDPIGFPAAGIIKKSVGVDPRIRVAKFVADKLEGVTQPYKNEFGNLDITSIFDVEKNMPGFNTKIMDTLTPKEKVDYVTDGLIKMYEPQFELDKVRINDILNNADPAEAKTQIENYIQQAYRGKGTIDDIIALEDNVLKDLDNAAIKEHQDFLKYTKESIDFCEDSSKVSTALDDLYAINDRLVNEIDEAEDLPFNQIYSDVKFESDVKHTTQTKGVVEAIHDLQNMSNEISLNSQINSALNKIVDSAKPTLSEMGIIAQHYKADTELYNLLMQYKESFAKCLGDFKSKLSNNIDNITTISHGDIATVKQWILRGNYKNLEAYKKLMLCSDDFEQAMQDLIDKRLNTAKAVHPELFVVKTANDVVNASESKAESFIAKFYKAQLKIADKVPVEENAIVKSGHDVSAINSILNSPEFKVVFGKTFDWQTITKTIDMPGWSATKVEEVIERFALADIENPIEYNAAYKEFYNFLDQYAKALRESNKLIARSTKYKGSTAEVIDELLKELDKYSIENYITHSKTLNSWEDCSVIMNSLTYSFMKLISTDSPVYALLKNIEETDINKMLADIDGSAAKIADLKVRENYTNGLLALQKLRASFEGLQKLNYTFANRMGFDEATYDSLMQAINKLNKLSATDNPNIDSIVERIIKNATDYDYFTYHASKAYNLETIGKRNLDELNRLRVINGFRPLADGEYETHIAVEDALNNYLAYQEAIKKEPLVLKDHKLYLDIESANINAHAGNNQIHSIAIVEIDDTGKIIDRHTVSLDPDAVELYKDSDALNKLGQTMDEYLDTIRKSSDTKYSSESDMLMSIQEWLQTKGYSPDSTTFITHNGKDFDIRLITDKAYQNHIDLRTVVNNKASKFTDFDNIDTLQLLRRQDGMVDISPIQLDKIKAEIRRYIDEQLAVGNTSLFTALDTTTFVNMDSLVDALHEINPFLAHQLFDWRSDVFDYLVTTRDSNKILAENWFIKDTINLDNIEYWKDFMRSCTTDPAELARIDNLQTINISSVLSMQGAMPKFASKSVLHTKIIDKWFKAEYTADKVAAGALTQAEAIQFEKAAKSLERYKGYVYDTEYIDQFAPMYTDIINFFVQKVPEFKILQKLDNKTDGADLYAICQYIFTKYTSNKLVIPSTGKHIEFEDILTDVFGLGERDATTISHIFLNYNKVTDPANTNYYRMFEGLKSYTGYYKINADVSNMRARLSDISAYKDANGIIGSAWITTQKIMQPMFDFIKEISKLDRLKLMTYERHDRQTMEHIVRAQALHIATKLNADNILPYMVDAGGKVRIQRTLLNSDSYKNLLKNLNNDDVRKLGVYLYDDPKADAYIWLTLDKSANITMSILDDENTISKTRYFANGVEIAKAERPTYNLSYENSIMTNKQKDIIALGGELGKVSDAINNLSDGAAAGSNYRIMNYDRSQELLNAMPKGALQHYDMDAWESATAFKTIRFDTSDITLDSSPFTARLYDSFTYTAEYLGAEQRYIQASFSDMTRINERTKLGKAILTDPKGAVKYFADNDTYMGVCLRQREKDGKLIMQSYDLRDPKQLVEGVQNGMQLMDYNEYATAYDIINNKFWSEHKCKGWNAFVRLYKIGYLSLNLGSGMRNAIDTLIKNTAETGEGAKMGKYYWEAMSKLQTFDRHAKALADFDISGKSLEEQAYFEGVKDMSYEEYTMLKKLMGIEVFGGESHTFTKLSKDYQDKMLQAYAAEGSIPTDIAAKYAMERKYYDAINVLLKPMSAVERVARYAEYFALADQGKTTSDIAAIVRRTHYDYTAKTAFEQMAEQVIPFYTFQHRNINHWIDLIDRDPHLFTVLNDILGPIWNLDSYDPDQIEQDRALQYHLTAGNIKVSDDLYINTSFSFMDALNRLLNYPKTIESTLFSPVEAVVSAVMQAQADHSYMDGNKLWSQWLQNEFGLKMTDQQIQDKYGEWTQNYYDLTNYKASQGLMPELIDNLKTWAMVPFIGTQINRFINTRTFIDDDNMIDAMLYFLGIGNVKQDKEYNTAEAITVKKDQYRTWLKSLGYPYDVEAMDLEQLKEVYRHYTAEGLSGSTKSRIYNMLRDNDYNVYLYSRLKATMGYADTSLSALPQDVQDTLCSVMTNTVDATPYIPILKDVKTMTYLWKNLANKYDIDVNHWDQVPADKLNSMYHDIARSVVEISDISNMLKDPSYRGAYSKAKKMLGYGDLKLSQLPCDSLSLIKSYMVGHSFTGKRSSGKSYYVHSNKVYHKMSYVRSPDGIMNKIDYHKGGTPTYTADLARKTRVQSHYNAHRSNPYSELYTKNGKMRQTLRMLPITPRNLQYRIQDHFAYMH